MSTPNPHQNPVKTNFLISTPKPRTRRATHYGSTSRRIRAHLKIPATALLKKEDDQTFEQKVQATAERRREMTAECLREEEVRKAKKRAGQSSRRGQRSRSASSGQRSPRGQEEARAENKKPGLKKLQRPSDAKPMRGRRRCSSCLRRTFSAKNDSVAYDSDDAPLGIAYHYYCVDVANMREEEQAMAASGHQLKFELSVVEYRREQREKAASRAAASRAGPPASRPCCLRASEEEECEWGKRGGRKGNKTAKPPHKWEFSLTISLPLPSLLPLFFF